MDNIKESKEYRLAKDWEMAGNDYGFNPKRFVAGIPDMHPTPQQSPFPVSYNHLTLPTVCRVECIVGVGTLKKKNI